MPTVIDRAEVMSPKRDLFLVILGFLNMKRLSRRLQALPVNRDRSLR